MIEEIKKIVEILKCFFLCYPPAFKTNLILRDGEMKKTEESEEKGKRKRNTKRKGREGERGGKMKRKVEGKEVHR